MAPSSEPTANLPLRVLVIDDEPLAEAIKLAWDSRVDESTKVSHLSEAELCTGESQRLNADVIIYPSYLIGELAERELIEPLDHNDAADPVFDRQGLFELIRLHEIVWGDKVYAVPLGSPQFMLLYRKDLFAKLEIEPPTTWEQYQVLAERLAEPSVGAEVGVQSEAVWRGAVEPSAPMWAGTMFLARAAAYARHRNQYSALFDFNTMDPLIATPPFERALNEMTALAAAQRQEPVSPDDALRKFLSGECAMAISWPHRTSENLSADSSIGEERIGIAELPGSSEVYNHGTGSWEQRADTESSHASLLAFDGRLGSVTKACRRKKHAFGMLFMISGTDLGSTISSASAHTALYRESHLRQAHAWVEPMLDGSAARQYGEVIQSALNRPIWIDAIRVPGRSAYLEALDKAIVSALDQTATATAALQSATSEWNKVTNSKGRDSQQRAYMRSLGLEP
ncbi:MAG: extracellular solute-binding protein [Planctomycetaceae bacterium]|nr:extracellular solute-binding protein [Planctomycetales bacterium]MCB9923476.1 extracellular solute-binding protein [Planctomycetaceae bacterium]